MLYTYRTRGTCSAEITFELDEDLAWSDGTPLCG